MSVHLPFFVAPANLREPIRLVSIELSSYPPNCNPFHHNLISMGTPLREGIIMMHATAGEDVHNTLEHVNQHTGQRFQLVAVPLKPRYIPFYFFREMDELHCGRAVFLSSTYEDNPSLRFLQYDWNAPNYVHAPAGTFESPVYIVYKQQMLLESIVKELTTEEIAAIIQKNSYYESSTADYFETAKAMKSYVE